MKTCRCSSCRGEGARGNNKHLDIGPLTQKGERDLALEWLWASPTQTANAACGVEETEDPVNARTETFSTRLNKNSHVRFAFRSSTGRMLTGRLRLNNHNIYLKKKKQKNPYVNPFDGKRVRCVNLRISNNPKCQAQRVVDNVTSVNWRVTSRG